MLISKSWLARQGLTSEENLSAMNRPLGKFRVPLRLPRLLHGDFVYRLHPVSSLSAARTHQHRLFAGLAQWGKRSTGWFFGFKLHLVCNDRGQVLSWARTPGNVDDRRPVVGLVRDLFGKLVADRGYISNTLGHQMNAQSALQLITKPRANDQLKNIAQIEHTSSNKTLTFFAPLSSRGKTRPIAPFNSISSYSP